ncbi:N-acylneuraminate cytidylyltransferase [Lactococcus hodotermopsidis]|uniref:N-acylneuraminate cytidylyltransferase n=1 Tax=Pseudolactococcus hodotermopsidis TaxID=2709157 RepID=A0A6A0B948_9LACT|nr:acylneuraminate cytidylyltransferase family protein [Lactococcus hodotermopsidis]GFH41882.1 N-acylneuraminate cytidylyltransferase [Lactococcus hodotermopsidis]
MKVVAFVPIKMNNERVPGKNTRSFENGEPLVTRILNTLSKVTNIDETYVYCSNSEIENFMPSTAKFLKRSEDLDQSTTKINEVISSFISDVEADIYVLAHATAPFITASSIEKGVRAVKSEKYDSSLSVLKLQEFLWKNEKPFNYSLDSIPRTQDLEPLYEETSGFYVFEKHLAKNENRRIGNKPYLVEVSKIEASDIDNPIDFDIANAIYNHIILPEEK